MSDVSQGPGWWLASDGKWYPPHTAPRATVAPDHDTATAERGAAAVPADPAAASTARPATVDTRATANPQGAQAYPPAASAAGQLQATPMSGFQAAPGPTSGTGYATGYGAPIGHWPGEPSGYGAGPASGVPAQAPTQVTPEVRPGAPRRHWQPWLALVGVALVLWGAGQGLLAWSEWHLVRTELSPYGTVTPGHLGMVLSAAGIVVAGAATLAVALVLDRR